MSFNPSTSSIDIVQHLLTLKTPKHFDDFFRQNPVLFTPGKMEELVETMHATIKDQNNASQQIQLISLIVFRDYAYLHEIISIGDQSQQIQFAERNEKQLLTATNYSILQTHYETANDDSVVYLDNAKMVLATLAASRFLQAIGNWPNMRSQLLKHSDWLLDPMANRRFHIFETLSPEENVMITEIEAVLESCRNVGVEEAVRSIDVQLLVGQLDNSTGRKYREVLEEIISLTHEKDNKLWADACSDLATSYSVAEDLPKGEAQEFAMQYYTMALSFYKPEEDPDRWASVKNSLGSLHEQLDYGNRADNIENAIGVLREILVIPFDQLSPATWALPRLNLAVAYVERLKGNQSENREEAIKFANESLRVYTLQFQPNRWASAHSQLGSAFNNRLIGNPADNLEKAIYHHQEALQIFTQTDYPNEWARVQGNLGIIYKNRINGVSKDNLFQADQCFKHALEYRRPEVNLYDWAETTLNYGNLHLNDLMIHEYGIGIARDAFNAIVNVNGIKQSTPFMWGSAMNALAATYVISSEKNSESDLATAINYLHEALSFITLDQYPRLFRNLCQNLGGALYDLRDWKSAREAFEHELEAVERMRLDSRSLESRKVIAKENVAMMTRLISCCIELNEFEAALEYTGMSKSRSFTETLTPPVISITEQLNSSPELSKAFDEISEMQAELNVLMLSVMTHDLSQTEKEIQYEKLRKDRIVTLREEIKNKNQQLLFDFPILLNLQTLPLLSARDIKQLSADIGNVTIVDYTMHQGWGVFIITESTLKYVGLDDDLYHLINEHLQLMVRDQFWKQNDWRSRLQQMYRLLIAPIKPYLPAQGKLVISPTNLLHLVPFQALMDKNGYYLADSFDLTFTQGTSALSRMLEQQKTLISYKEKKMSGTLLNIANSGPVDNYLDTVLDEALSIEKFFDRSVQLFEGDATPETIIKTISGEFFNVIHVNCHGHFDFFDPGASGLLLAEERVLSIEEIRLKMRLKTYPLVVLSACQTNFVRPEQGEETPGIAWSFLTSGAGTVISSQWSVSSQATKELFEHFYRFRKNESLSNAEALRQAMLELRKKRAYTSTPYYWAAFQATGLP